MTNKTTSRTLKKMTAAPLNAPLCYSLLDNSTLNVTSPLQFEGIIPLANLDYCEIDLPRDAFLASMKLEAIFQRYHASYRSYPVELFNVRTREILSTSYRLIFLKQVDLEDYIDWEKSEIIISSELHMRVLKSLVLNTSALSLAEPAICFRNRTKMLVSDRIREQIVHQKLKGIAFAPLHAFFNPRLGLEEQELVARLAKDPENAQNWYELAAIQTQLFSYQDAESAVKHALLLNPNYSQAWHLHGHLLHLADKPDEALEAYKHEMTTNPHHIGAKHKKMKNYIF